MRGVAGGAVLRESPPPYGGPRPQPRPRLSERALEAMRLRRFSPRTQEAYLGWMRRYHEFHGRRHPASLGRDHVTAFLNHLAARRKVAASTQNQALAALLFLYREVLGIRLPWLDDLVHARRPARLPVVLTRDEVEAILGNIEGVPRLMATLLYGSGLRLLECCRLRVRDIDFGQNQIVVRNGKGGRDRITLLPASVSRDLERHLSAVHTRYRQDLEEGAGWVALSTPTSSTEAQEASDPRQTASEPIEQMGNVERQAHARSGGDRRTCLSADDVHRGHGACCLSGGVRGWGCARTGAPGRPR